MKKTLLATTALVAVGAVAAAQPASAAERINVMVGGYMEQWFGYSDNDQDRFDGFDEQTDAEIHFTGSTKLDNGIEFGINVQLEGQTDGDQIDEQYLFVEGSFGRLLMGSENAAHYLMHYAPPDAGIGVNSGDLTNWIPNTTGASYFDGIGTTFARSGDNDSEKITYFTPRFEGFQFGISYIPEFAQDDDTKPDDTVANFYDGISLGLNFDRKFNDFRTRASVGYLQADADGGFTDDIETWNAGLRLGYGGFEIAASGAWYEGGPTGGSYEGETYHFGGMYSNGPFAVSLAYLMGEQEDAVGGGDDELEAIFLGLGYTLGPGIDVKSSIFYGDWEAETGNGTDNDGYGIVAGFDLSF